MKIRPGLSGLLGVDRTASVLFPPVSYLKHSSVCEHCVSLRPFKPKDSLKNLLKDSAWGSGVEKEPSELGEIPPIKQLLPRCSAHSAEEQSRMKADLSGEETACSVSNSRWLIKVSLVLIRPRSVSVKLHAVSPLFFPTPSRPPRPPQPPKSVLAIYLCLSESLLLGKAVESSNRYNNQKGLLLFQPGVFFIISYFTQKQKRYINYITCTHIHIGLGMHQCNFF